LVEPLLGPLPRHPPGRQQHRKDSRRRSYNLPGRLQFTGWPNEEVAALDEQFCRIRNPAAWVPSSSRNEARTLPPIELVPTRPFGRTEIGHAAAFSGGNALTSRAGVICPRSDHCHKPGPGSGHRRARRGGGDAPHRNTARHYGTSERPIGRLLPEVPDPSAPCRRRFHPKTQTRPCFEAELECAVSAGRELMHLHMLPSHGLQTFPTTWSRPCPRGCLEVARRWAGSRADRESVFSTPMRHCP